MSNDATGDLPDRVRALEERLERLERLGENAASTPSRRPTSRPPAAGTLWAVRQLEELGLEGGAVMLAGVVDTPTGRHYEWQEGRAVAELLEGGEGAEAASRLSALGHPVRLLLVRAVLQGAQTVGELKDHEALGTTGQLYHHLRQLVAAGWLRATGHGHYDVPPERVVPLLAVLAATGL